MSEVFNINSVADFKLAKEKMQTLTRYSDREATYEYKVEEHENYISLSSTIHLDDGDYWDLYECKFNKTLSKNNIREIRKAFEGGITTGENEVWDKLVSFYENNVDEGFNCNNEVMEYDDEKQSEIINTSTKSKKKEILKVSAIGLLVIALGGLYFSHHGKKKDDTLFDEQKPVVKQGPVKTEPQQPVVAKKWQDMKYSECMAVYNDGYNKKMNLLIKAKDGMEVNKIEQEIKLPECNTLPDSPRNLKLKEQQQVQTQSVVVPKAETTKPIDPPKQALVEQPKPVVALKSKLNVVDTQKVEVAEQPKPKHEIKHVHKQVKDIVVTEPKQVQVQKSQSPTKAWYE